MAGTDANVEIWLTDQTGKTAGPIKITEKGDAMERGQSNPITINLISELKGRGRFFLGFLKNEIEVLWDLKCVILNNKSKIKNPKIKKCQKLNENLENSNRRSENEKNVRKWNKKTSLIWTRG